jgi:citrate lyase subunit beta/citryl-CoA lyase
MNDGPCTSWEDSEVLAADSQRARKLGFGGKLCIHPKQVAIVNAALAPTEAEIASARRGCR